MSKRPKIRIPAGLSKAVVGFTCPEAEQRLPADLLTLREIVSGLDRLEARLDVSPIPQAVTLRGYFTPDEDDRVRQGVLIYRNYRLAAYEIILRYRDYADMEPGPSQLRSFLLAFGAALVLYAKSLKIIAFAEHVPMLRAKINEPDCKYDLEAGFFDDVLAGYSQLCNYRSMVQAGTFWRVHRREAHALAREPGRDWVWLVDLIRHQRRVVRRRLLHVLWQRFRHDWRAFARALLSPFRRARHGVERLLGDRLAQAQIAGTAAALTRDLIARLRPGLKPGDILLMRNDHRLTASLLPGFWTHAAIFLGGRSDLEALGLRAHPHVARHWGEIPEKADELGLVIEAQFPCVQFNPLEKCLQMDHLVVLHPTLSAGDIREAIAEAVSQLGKPYDFEFDFNNSSRIVCTELVYRSFHSRGALRFSLTKRLGRFTLTGDDLIAHALDGIAESGDGHIAPLQPVALLLRRRDGQCHAAPPERILPWLRRIHRGWRPVRHDRVRAPSPQASESLRTLHPSNT